MTPDKKSSRPHHHNLRSLSTQGGPPKTLVVKGKSISTKIANNYEGRTKMKDHEETVHFATERINLPRGKFKKSSTPSSACNSQSPLKLPRALANQDPKFLEKNDYYKDYWKMYLQNESLVSDIETTAHSNYKMSKKIYNLEDYYEHHLIPQLLTYPHKFVHRLR